MAGPGRCARHARPTRERWRASSPTCAREGRWLVTPASAVSQPSEAFYIGEMIRDSSSLALVAEADGEVVGNVLISVERSVVSDHVGTLSICVADGWREVGIGSALVEAAKEWARRAWPGQGRAGRLPGQRCAPSPSTSTPASRARALRRRQYRVPGGEFRDELLMAWFPDEGAPA